MKRMILVLLFAALLLAACGGAPSGASTPIRLALGYIPNIQFAPIYVAVEKGYFTDRGIDLEIVHMDENQATALVGANELQFAVVSGEQVLLAREQGLPVVYAAAWYQQYPVSVISAAALDIHAPADLAGHTIGLPGLYGANYIGLRALLHAGGLGEADVALDSIGYAQVEAFVSGRNPVIAVYTANEPVQLRAQGYAVNEMRVADYVQLASNGLLTSETVIAENPDLVEDMVAALVAGIEETIADPDGAYEISASFVENLDLSPEAVQRQVLATSIELWRAERIGHSDPQAWENMQAVLLEMELLSAPQDLSQAFTNEFVP
ncbi:MAG: ABC transporter substrate-binding protein [Anaerolineales bacterium]|nr:ABC transporter substrate-binding protein [Anaerolineales bacterium]